MIEPDFRIEKTRKNYFTMEIFIEQLQFTNLTKKHFLEQFFNTILLIKHLKLYPLFSYQLGAFTTFYAGATSNYQDNRNDSGISKY